MVAEGKRSATLGSAPSVPKRLLPKRAQCFARQFWVGVAHVVERASDVRDGLCVLDDGGAGNEQVAALCVFVIEQLGGLCYRMGGIVGKEPIEPL